MKKKLDTRFPAAQIKKIMQADEDVGKIAMVVPLLVSKALELFLQELCNRTHEITLRKGAKTVNSLHLKQCVQTFNVFDFLKEIVGKVPDLAGSDTAAAGDDHSVPPKRRKVANGENDTDSESKRIQCNESIHAGITAGGRGKGRGRGRGGLRDSDQGMPAQIGKLEDNCNHCDEHDPERGDDLTESREIVSTIKSEKFSGRNFDLNIDLDENGDSQPVVPGSQAGSSADMTVEEKHGEEYPGWSLSDAEKMAIDPLRLANFGSMVEYEEDDYDEEDC
ncbi:hypothetical protein MLD38_040241 [Melastoma candidum]|uniref:Uncharacterized protein n=1 Tax=Melastoma candidum TaxID=119954 RepID=A0ACB9L5E5_9MYRT|nr:hypothetical protein MLD38_040241 [Melastoma candidum]